MKVVFTRHALGKFKHPSIIKLGIKRKHIKSVLAFPDYSDKTKTQKEDMQRPKIVYEPEDDVLNIWLSKEPYDFAEDENGAITHYTKEGEPVYIEILDASRFFKKTAKNITAQPSVTHRLTKPSK